MSASNSAPLLLKRAKLDKQPGVLTIAQDAVSWQPNDPNGPQQAASVAVSAITNQQRAKGKPFLRVVTLGRPLVFELESVEDVDVVVDTLAPLLPRAAGATPLGPDPHAAFKAKLLKDDADLSKLYEQLVLSGVLSADEFWKGRSHLLKAGTVTAQQRVGLSSAMLTDMQPNPDGKSDTVRVKLTPAMVHQIFAEKPHVKRAFQANVPTRIMTNNDFWAKFLRHQLLQQNARRAGSADRSFQEEEEFFAKYEREEDEAARRQDSAVNPADDLTADQNDDTYTGYGVWHSSRQDPVDSGKPAKGSLIRDINRHAQVVMDGMPASLPADAADAAAALAASAPEPSRQNSSREALDAAQRPAPGGSGLDDLRPQPVPDFSELRIQDPRQTFDAAATTSAGADDDPSSLQQAAQAAHEALMRIDPMRLEAALPDDLALQVLADIMHDSEGGSGGATAGGAAEALLPQVLGTLRQHVLAANELLRHMWACFPLASQQRQAKAERLSAALSQQFEGLQRMEDAASGVERRHIAQLLRPVKESIDAALAKLDASKENSTMMQT